MLIPLKFFNDIYLFIVLCVDTQVPYHTCGGQKTTNRAGSLLPRVHPGDEIRVVRLGSRNLGLLSCLTGPDF